MAVLSISEYGGLVQTHGGVAHYVQEPALARQDVTYTASTQSAAFGTNTKVVVLCADEDAYLEFGPNPTADASSFFLPANTIWVVGVKPGDEVAAYDGTT